MLQKMASSTYGDETADNTLDLEMAKKHEEWMAKYGCVYKDEAEKARRFEIFKKNVKYIEDFNNSGEPRYTLGVNQFADLTNEEFAATYTGGVKIPEEDSSDSVCTSYPSRAQGACTNIKHHGTTSGKKILFGFLCFHFIFSDNFPIYLARNIKCS